MNEEEEQSSSESELPTSSDECIDIDWISIATCVLQNPQSTNIMLFSFLALLKAYVPESYLLLSECQTVLGPPDLIFGGPPFEERMRFFISCITTDAEQVSLIKTDVAEIALRLLEILEISKIQIARNLIHKLCTSDVHPHTAQFIKMLLTKRRNLEEGKTKFSQFIEECSFRQRVSILKTAANKFRNIAIYPQTISRLYYIETSNVHEAIRWANEAIRRAPDSSYTHDTLGQIYKSRIRRYRSLEMAHLALKAFEDVERKAEAERNPGLIYTNEGSEHCPKTFNNRGLFGFIQVAKIIYETKLSKKISTDKVEEIFNFFERYLTYSRPDRNTFEPKYFWKDVALCLRYYKSRNASASTSFPGLLRYLDRQLGQPLDLESIQSMLKLNWEENESATDAERYILSNILLCNQTTTNSNHHAPVEELQRITKLFITSTHKIQSPEFYLLVSLLFWPEDENEGVDAQSRNEPNSSEERTTEGIEDRSEGIIDLPEQVNNMEKAFENARYAKYLHGRYLVPLFFLGNGPGLTKWVHRSKLDAIVGEKVNADVHNRVTNEEMVKESCEIWSSGEVWHIPQIQELLQPVNVEPCESTSEGQDKEMVLVRIGKSRIKARTEPLDVQLETPLRYYLGFNIRGPIVFTVGPV